MVKTTSSVAPGTPEGLQLPAVFHVPLVPPAQVLVAAFVNKIRTTKKRGGEFFS